MPSEFEQSVREFWDWFSFHAHELSSADPSSPLFGQLDQRISDLTDDIGTWEIGPGVSDSKGCHALALSPDCDHATYEITQRIVQQAPNIPGWEFYPAKPRKEWKRKFRWGSRGSSIDASDWEFLLYKYNDGMIEVVLISDVLGSFDLDERLRIVEFVVESELGELDFMGRVSGVDVDDDPPKNHLRNSVKISQLRESVISETPPCQ